MCAAFIRQAYAEMDDPPTGTISPVEEAGLRRVGMSLLARAVDEMMTQNK